MNKNSYIKYFLTAICFQGLFFLFPQTAKSQTPSWAWAKGVHTTATEWATDIAVDPTSGDVVAVGVFNGGLNPFYGLNFLAAFGGGFVAKYDSAGNVLWAFPIGNNQDDACNAVTISSLGNIYVTGYFQLSADFKGTSLFSNILFSNGGKDMFIAKYNSAGALQWVQQGGGILDDEGYGVTVNLADIFVTGYFTNSGNFSGIPTASNRPNENIFVTSYDAMGNIQWLTDAGSGQSCFGRDIVADNNNVFVTGDFKNTTLSVYDNTGFLAGSVTNSSAASEDLFIMSLSAAGPFNWVKGAHSNGQDFGRGMTQSGSNIYITGSTSSSANFPGYVSNPVAVGALGLDMFVAQFDKLTGNTNWVKSEPGANNEEGESIVIDTLNAVCVAGYFQSTLNFSGGPIVTSSGNEDVFIAAYNTSGNFKWVTQAGDIGTDIPHGISTYSTGEIYTAGEYKNNAVFGANTLTADSPPNIFVAKIGCVPVNNNTVSSAQTICANQIPATLIGSTPSGGSSLYTYLWEQSPNNLTWSAASGTNNTQNYSPPALTANTYFRRTVYSSGACLSSLISSSILISVDQPPTTSNAGNDQGICAPTATLSANNPTVGTGTWLQISGTGTITSVTSPTTSVSGLSSGLNTFVWSISNGVCITSQDTVLIKVNAPPTIANAGTNQTICASTTTALSANTPTVGTGAWSVISGSGVVTSTTSPNSTVSGLSTGSNIFMWTISSGTCPSSTSTVSINVSAAPSTSNAGPNQIHCAASSVTLSANNPAVGTGTWTLVSGGGTFTSVNSYSSAVNSLPAGVNVFMWTISNGTCPASTSTVSITIYAMPSASNAGSNQNICAATTTTLSANAPTVGTGAWMVVSGGGIITTTNSPASGVTNLSAGQNIFMWTISNGTCPASTSTVSINVSAAPSTSNAGSNQTICVSTTTALSANAPTVGTGAWSVISGGGIITTTNSPTSNVTNLSVGQNIFMWTISNGTCPVSTSTVSINVSAAPSTSNAGSNQTICASTTTTLSANTPIVGTGAWSVVSGGGIITTTNSPTSGVTNLSAGQNIFMWTISNGTCPASTSTVSINVSAAPSTSNAGSNQTICASTTATLSANTPTVGTGAWSAVSGGGIITTTNSPTSNVTNLSVGQNIFMWTISNGTCPTSTSTVSINVSAAPSTSNAGSNQNICASTTAALSANAPTVGTGAWSVVLGGGIITTTNSPTSNVTNLSIGQNILKWTISNGTCPVSTSTVSINVSAAPSNSNAGSNQTICASTTTTLSANAPTVGTGVWSVVSGGGIITTTNSPASGVTNLSAGQNIFMWTISNGTCPVSTSTVSINVSAAPSTSNAGSNQTICASTTTVLSANTPTVGTGAWSVVSGGGIITTINSPTSSVTNLTTGQNIFMWTISNGTCPTSTSTVSINISVMPTNANAGPDILVYNPAVNMNANTPLTGTGVWSVISGSGNFSNNSNPTTQVNNLQFGQNIFMWTISNGSCPASQDEVIITLNELTVPNGFSPNGDGINDDFEIPGLLQYSNVKLDVFNRWGNLVYHNDDYKNNWYGQNTSGELLTDDTYFFTLEITGKKTYKGFVVKKSHD